MKYKMLALILALTVVSWAQTEIQNTPSTPQQSTAPEKAKCACCDKMAASDSKDTPAACMQKHDGKETASCCAGKDEKSGCGGKDAMSCMKRRQDGRLLQRQRRHEVRPNVRQGLRERLLRIEQERKAGVEF
jgi:hypothetical protein